MDRSRVLDQRIQIAIDESVRIIGPFEWRAKKGSDGCPWHVPSAGVHKRNSFYPGFVLPCKSHLSGAAVMILATLRFLLIARTSTERKSLSFIAKRK
ncbi:hypothetical protein PUN28_006546 [Cardiocondyla obscurior]|uniref:Uncharacterized protein n=1 Tax=Cardiocondyla obscurior TaxID=286306 RepID=A0AAW2GC09_9HYME